MSYALVMQVREPVRARATVSANPDSRRMDRAELSARLRLLETPGIRLTTARRLLLATGSAEGVFELPPSLASLVLGAPAREALAKAADSLDALTEQTWVWLPEADPRHSLLTPADPDYPPRLLESPGPPCCSTSGATGPR